MELMLYIHVHVVGPQLRDVFLLIDGFLPLQGTFLNDLIIGLFCPLCSYVQEAQVSDLEERSKVSTEPAKLAIGLCVNGPCQMQPCCYPSLDPNCPN